jgi:hypothetical protein
MTTRGREMFEEHMRYVRAQDIAGMVRDTFHDEAVYYHNFPFFETPPPFVITGKDKIIAALSTIFERQGDIRVGEPMGWSESDNHIAFQILVTSPNTGSWLVSDFWYLRDGKVFLYFGYGMPMPLQTALP